MNALREVIDVDSNKSDNSDKSEKEIISKEKGKSWVYMHSEKREINGKKVFICLVTNKCFGLFLQLMIGFS